MRSPQGGYTFQAPLLSPLNKYLIILSAVVFLLQSLVNLSEGISLGPYLGLSFEMISRGHLYQLITYPFAHSGFFTFLFNALLLWFLGSDLEFKWGQKIYIHFFLSSVLGSALIYLALASLFFADGAMAYIPVMGLNGFCCALCLAYGLIYSDRYLTFMLIFPMRAKYFCAIIVGIELYIGIFSPYGKASWAHLGAMLSGFIYLRAKAHFISRAKSSPQDRQRKRRSRANLYLVKDEDEDNSKGPRYWH